MESRVLNAIDELKTGSSADFAIRSGLPLDRVTPVLNKVGGVVKAKVVVQKLDEATDLQNGFELIYHFPPRTKAQYRNAG